MYKRKEEAFKGMPPTVQRDEIRRKVGCYYALTASPPAKRPGKY